LAVIPAVERQQTWVLSCDNVFMALSLAAKC
jgi:hypothetical protein